MNNEGLTPICSCLNIVPFIYYPGCKMTGDNADALKILAAEPLPQNGKRAVLFLDGHVERIDEVDYQQKIKK